MKILKTGASQQASRLGTGKRPASRVEGMGAGRPPPPAEQAAWQHTLVESGCLASQWDRWLTLLARSIDILRDIEDEAERREFLAQTLVEGPTLATGMDVERPARGSTSTEGHFPRADGLA